MILEVFGIVTSVDIYKREKGKGEMGENIG